VALPRHTSRALQKAQESARTSRLSNKNLHGQYYHQCQQGGSRAEDAHAWLVHGKFRSETEALAVAIQDGVVHTKAYRKGVFKDHDLPDDLCRYCGDAPETVGHHLAACEDLHWNLHKERHDMVVYQLLLALLGQFNLTEPDSLKWHSGGWNGIGEAEGPGVKIEVDLSHLTEA